MSATLADGASLTADGQRTIDSEWRPIRAPLVLHDSPQHQPPGMISNMA